ncbi:ABC transporter substrate-binding protein [Priestia taiwanensis]|uniref:Peptide-binding protein n=1 Tax=Priestia taiwanensis TaxID=1347902 RepID=A0A917ENS3_9BACI|nr:ABC transporter substrate-binding protein [Priestia taiwanensis]MBM7362227.1 MarR-like DNA-binding transcriptional regulator SgrR of sgrS sRNA [Priestia taiwanensis]GGE60470.1 peptide-binding protein [Priestia taiwanensis]
MVTLEHYVRLWLAQEAHVRCGVAYDISLQLISDKLFCTIRNSKLIIKKMEEAGWIVWIPGKGRGNSSKITFLKNTEQLIFSKAQELVKQGNIKAANKVIDTYQTMFGTLRLQFDTWIHTLFGYHVERENDAQYDVLRLRMELGHTQLDPVHITLRSECHFVKHICDTLVHFNCTTNTIEPHIVFHWEKSMDSLEWTFYIRKGITFHHGKKLDAHDILYTFERFLFHEDNKYKWLLENVESMQVIQTHCFKIKLKKENALFLHFLSDEHLSILPKEEFERNLDTDLIGTGSFQLLRNDDSMFVIQAYEHYFRERSFLDRIEIWNMEEDNYLDDISFGMTEHHEGDSSWKHHIQRETNVTYISLNANKSGPMQNKYFRKALQQIINRDKLIEQLRDFRGERAPSFISSPGDKNELYTVEYLLERSNYQGELLHIVTFADKDHMEDCTWIQEECAKYGINIEPKFVCAEELLQPLTLQYADLIHESATIGGQVELSFLHLLLSSSGPVYHHIGSSMREWMCHHIQELLAMEKEERNRMFNEMEYILIDEGNLLPLYRHNVHIEHHETVQNVQLNAEGWIDFHHIWFKERK